MIDFENTEIAIREFPGFYDSPISEDLDYLRNDFDELFKGKCPEEMYKKLQEEFFKDVYNYYDGNERDIDVAKQYVDAYNELLQETPLACLELEYVELTHPREYNFTTDKVWCKVKGLNEEALHKIAEEMVKNKEYFAKKIKEDFTSRDGFCSFVSNDYDFWLKVFECQEDVWDEVYCTFHSMLGYAIGYIVERHSYKDYEEDLIYECQENICESLYVDYGKLLTNLGYTWDDIDDTSRQLDLEDYLNKKEE